MTLRNDLIASLEMTKWDPEEIAREFREELYAKVGQIDGERAKIRKAYQDFLAVIADQEALLHRLEEIVRSLGAKP
jgi:hypothetical protein